MMDKMTDEIRELVERTGYTVRQGTPECKEWNSSHENCFGCPYEVGCAKTVCIWLTILASNEVSEVRIYETIEEIIACKSAKGLRKIHIPEMAY